MEYKYINPTRVIWESAGEKGTILNSSALLEDRSPQITIVPKDPCVFRHNGSIPSVLLDFGKELHGGIQIFCWRAAGEGGARVRVRFGESAMEAMSGLGGKSNATNDHALRDLEVRLVDMSMTPVGQTGFRFVRIDLLEEGSVLELKAIKAVLLCRDIPYQGEFRCNDELLNEIWRTGAYTVHLNMQNYIWDGIKRDRLVWMGDMHPEIMTIAAVFGADDIVEKSLDFVKEDTPLPGWINNMPTYSMWWIITQYDWYQYKGDLNYLKEQRDYLIGLCGQLSEHIDESGKDCTPEHRFVDWPSSANPEAVDHGIQALHYLAALRLRELFLVLGEKEYVLKCEEDLIRLQQFKTSYQWNKQSAALLALAGLHDVKKINQEILSKDGAKGFSTFMGYYILQAKAKAGDIQGALECIREYYGAMLKLGATTFWEDFDLSWMENGAGIDELVPEDKVDIHATYGDYCYQGYRHSLCHGWAGAVTAWISERILGIQFAAPGGKKVFINPQLGDLTWVEGAFPTQYGIIRVRHEKQKDGRVTTNILECPEQVELV
ncbi:MAG TPA: alpha-L-rhamnosidase [Clostridiales bacterium]|nr:alpha-L-rhamnosidase [Clostridiales bacterium]